MSATGKTGESIEVKSKYKLLKHSPFGWLDEQEQKQAALIFWIILIIVSLLFGYLFNPLLTDAAPRGVISFELPAIGKSLGTIAALQSWKGYAHLIPLAKLSLKLDFIYIVLYAIPLSISSLLAARSFLDNSLSLFGKTVIIIMSWAAMVAALFDGLENYFLMSIIDEFNLLHVISPAILSMANTANGFAVMKFVLLLLVLLFLLFSFTEKIVTLVCGSSEQNCRAKGVLKG